MTIRPLIACLLTSLLSTSTIAQDWMPLFDGQSLNGWTTEDGKPVEHGAWTVDQGAIHLDTKNGRGGNLLSDREYGDFELVFEFMIPEGANNGIKYRVSRFDGRTLGLEYQIIDDHGMTELGAKHTTASLYDIHEAHAIEYLNPPGFWNRGRIVVAGDRIEHWLNGHQIVATDVGSAAWEDGIQNSKFNDVSGFGRNRIGKIMLTDHRDSVWLKNIFIREFNVGRAGLHAPSGEISESCCMPCRRPTRWGNAVNRKFGRSQR